MAKTLLISWLRKVHAMGQEHVQLLERYGNDFEAHPDIRSELQQHLAETKQQITDVQECLQTLGAKPLTLAQASTAGDSLQKTAARSKDVLVKNLLALYASEQLAYGHYSALAEGARHLMADEVADICERIAEEEAAMAEWVEEQIPAVVAMTLTMHGDQ